MSVLVNKVAGTLSYPIDLQLNIIKITHMRSFGMELEWSNVDKNIPIPEELGYWEGKGNHSEIDIINVLHGPTYVPGGDWSDMIFQAAWPNKQWGGEINTKPTKTIEEQLDVIWQIRDLLYKNNLDGRCIVTPVSNGHVHVRDDAFDDVENLKKLYRFVLRNQDIIISHWLEFGKLAEIKKSPYCLKQTWHYMRNDGGKRLSANFLEPVEAATTLDEFYRAIVPHAKESGNILWARAGRQGINLHSLRHTGTVEFRCMKASVRLPEIKSQLEFANDFVDRVLNDRPDYTEEDLKQFPAVPTDPYNFFDKQSWLDGQKDWWDSREERKKAGTKTRIGRIEI